MTNTRRPERVLMLVAAAIIIALLAGYLFSARTVPVVLRYVPLESNAFVVTAPLNELWHGLAPHLGRYFSDPDADVGDERTEARRMGLDLRAMLESKKIVLYRAEDMAAIGVDGSREAAAAMLESDGSMHVLLMVPVLDRKRFIKTLEDFVGEAPQELESPPGSMLDFDGVILSFGDDDMALLSDSPDIVRRALDGGAIRLAYFRSNDRLGHAFAAALPDTKGARTAWMRGRVRLVDPSPVGGELYFAVAADETALAVEGRMGLAPARSRLVESLLRREPLQHYQDALPRSDLAVALNSAALAFQLRDLTALSIVGDEPMGGYFAPVFDELKRSGSVQGLSVAVSDANQRVPGVVLGLRMGVSDADAFLLRLQSSFRFKRDQEILRSARTIYMQQFDGQGMPNSQSLLDAGVLKAERGELWSRYPSDVASTAAEPDPPFTARDFGGDEYVRTSAGGTLRFLMPPFTDNDLAHRFAKKGDKLQVDELRADRYRLCSIYHNGSLWIGNDGVVLENWMERLRVEAQSPNFADAAILDPDAAHAKMLAVVQPVRLFEAGQLYPDNDVNKMARQWLTDLAPYRTVLVGLSTDPQEQELYVRATLLRR